MNPHVASGYTRENLSAFVERSAANLEVEALELLQLHCPPTDVYYMPEVFGVLDDLKRAGKLKHYGVSVERVEEALKAIEYPEVQSIQIVFNIFRQRPAEHLFAEAQRRKVGILARLPLSSGLLGGKMKPGQQFAADDHRAFNRTGAAFDRGETFSGVDFETGLEVVEELRAPAAQRDVTAAICAALDRHARRGHLLHPGRPAPRSGRGKRCGLRAAAAQHGRDATRKRALRCACPTRGASALVHASERAQARASA